MKSEIGYLMNVLVLVLVQKNDNSNQNFYGGCNYHKVNDKNYIKIKS